MVKTTNKHLIKIWLISRVITNVELGSTGNICIKQTSASTCISPVVFNTKVKCFCVYSQLNIYSKQLKVQID